MGLILVRFDRGVAFLFELLDEGEELKFLVSLHIVFLTIFVFVANLTLTQEIISVDFLWLSEDLALLVMIVDVNLVLVDHELSFSNLLFWRLVWIELELLCHFLDKVVLEILFVVDNELRLVNFLIVSYTSVDQSIFSALESLKDLLTDVFLSIDESILISVVIEVNLSPSVINLDHFLPVVVLLRRLVVLNCLELIWESSSKDELISSVLEVRSHFFDDKLFVVFVHGYSLNETVDFFAS